MDIEPLTSLADADAKPSPWWEKRPFESLDAILGCRRLRAEFWRRRWRSWLFAACVLLPTLATSVYEFGFASDQYVSAFKFVVSQQTPQTTEISTLASDLGGGNPLLQMIEDSEVVVQYIGSSQILDDLAGTISLDRIYGTPDADFLSRMRTGAPLERQLLYWRKVVVPSFDMSSGVITVAVRAFSPGDALRVAQAVLASSQALVNQMSAQARQNALAYAEQTAADASRQLLADEGRLAVYRNKYAVLYPELSAQSGASVDDQLTAQLSEDQATLASLQSEGQTENSPQIRTLRANIAAIRAQIDRIAATIAAAKPGETQSLASVVSGYDTLTAAAAIDQQLYNSDLLALQNARNKAAEESIYLETFVQPSQPQSSIYPQRGLLICEIAFAGFILWVLSILLINTIRDQTD
jgi:capsular polysaccharide transport system permease protein